MKIDFAKRRQVMERSMKLGHCICEPRRPCPCDVFRNDGICPCAGERPDPVDLSQLKLTSLVRNPGCASKIAPADLEAVLGRLPTVDDPAVISGLAAADDAGVYRLTEDLCLVQTVDVFTPCVDDPHLFGRICASNCLSDIYAMGGEPRTALSIAAFPTETLHGEVLFQMLAGAMKTLEEAGVALIGGHSIKDNEIKLGFAITGVIDRHLAESLDQPRAGDVLVLTKRLGTGVLAFAEQIGRDRAMGTAAAEQSMTALNKAAAEAMKAAGASACTDITGFGLFAHLVRMLRSHGLSAEVIADALPAFDGVIEALREQVIPGAVERNREFVGGDLRVDANVEEARIHLGFDAQTSGGLLIAVPPDRLNTLQAELSKRRTEGFVIGRMIAETSHRILVTNSATCTPATNERKRIHTEGEQAMPSASETHQPECRADTSENANALTTVGESQEAFGALMRAAQGPGVVDEKTKELILFSLVVQSRCAPCFAAHFERALKLGLTRAELDEAAWCAIAMGGAPVKMFYQECLERVSAGSAKTCC